MIFFAIIKNHVFFGINLCQFIVLIYDKKDHNSSDRKFDTKLISILHGYLANQTYFSTLHGILFENSSKVLQKLTMWRYFALTV